MIGTKSNNTSNRVFLRSFNLLHVFAKPIIARIIKIKGKNWAIPVPSMSSRIVMYNGIKKNPQEPKYTHR